MANRCAIWHLYLDRRKQSQIFFDTMNDSSLNTHSFASSSEIIYPLFRIERAKPQTKRTSRLSLSKNKSRKGIHHTHLCLPETESSKANNFREVDFSGFVEEKNTLPSDELGVPNEHIFQQFETEDGKVYREREVTNLLDDPEYQFLDSYEPEFKSSAQVFPTGSDLKQQLCPPQASPLDIHDEYCGKFAKHSKNNCWEANPWLMPIKLIKMRARDEACSNYGRKDCDKSFRWADILSRKSDGVEMDALEDKRDELAEYENRLQEKADQLDKEKEKTATWEKMVREKFLPQHTRFPIVTRLRSDFKEVDVESMVDAYTEKVFEEYTSTADFNRDAIPETIMGKDEDVVILMRFNENQEETRVIRKVGFSLGDTDDCHHDVKVKFVPPFVPTKEYY